jgi:hypothetical protein
MVESLWYTADDYLAAALLATMGADSAYQTLQINSVQIWAQFDAVDFTPIPRPFSIISSYDSTTAVDGIGQDGSARLKRANTYRYVICSVVDGTKAQATRDAKILVWRQEQMLAGLRFVNVAAIDGSKIGRILNTKDTYFLRSNVALWQRSSSSNENMYGLAITAFALTGATV